MARTIAVIQQFLIDTLVAAGALVGEIIVPGEWSDYDYRQLISYMVAVGQAVLEQNMDAHKADIEALIDTAAPITEPWIKSRMLKFQYSATNPQVIELDTETLTFKYPEEDDTLKIIKFCSVPKGGLGRVYIKCATDAAGVPVQLDTDQKNAAQSYVNATLNPGITYIVSSEPSDKMFIEATIYFNGLYAAVIQDNVKAAIKEYLAVLSVADFDGTVYLSKLVDAIQKVPGVLDVVLNNVSARPDSVPYGSGTGLVVGNTEFLRSWKTVAGYIVTETDSGHTIDDSLHFEAV